MLTTQARLHKRRPTLQYGLEWFTTRNTRRRRRVGTWNARLTVFYVCSYTAVFSEYPMRPQTSPLPSLAITTYTDYGMLPPVPTRRFVGRHVRPTIRR